MDAGDKERCPTGNRPHTMAEDKDGNIWVSLKFGAVARLSRPQDIADPRDRGKIKPGALERLRDKTEVWLMESKN